MKRLSHVLEFAFVWAFYTLCRLLPFRAASALGGTLGWFIATLPASFNQTARANLRKAFPDMPAADMRRTQQAALVNFARTMAEFPQVYRLPPAQLAKKVDIRGLEHIGTERPILMMTGHVGNWDMLGMALAAQGIPCASVYRAANNPLVDRLMVGTRALSGAIQIPKGAHGARQILKTLGQKHSVGMLIDQKMNDGIAAPFFGHQVMTAPALAELALKKNLPVIPAFCWRTSGGRFTAEVWPPVQLTRTGDHQHDVQVNTALFNKLLEDAITRNPEQWMWFHRRFPKEG
ncbi:MAG: lauroyl acyltransferase [Proteobacteria bacterium]|nr:lauroyl acyltransferase [Pseudomonadota bacterium]